MADDDVDPGRLVFRVARDCRVCPTRDKTNCNWRQFGDPEAKCPEHGKGVKDPDRPYVRPPRRLS